MTQKGSADTSGYRPISAYGLIGDCHTAALVSDTGSIDWYCPGRFDGPAVFCRLLDAQRGGFWSIRPTGQFTAGRRYLPGTNILQTTFDVGDARLEVTDFMPIKSYEPLGHGYDVSSTAEIARLVQALGADIEVEIRFWPTFDYARAPGSFDLRPGVVTAHARSQYLTLTAPGLEFRDGEPGGLSAVVHVRPGERLGLVLTTSATAQASAEAPAALDLTDKLRATASYWRRWADRCTYRGPYRNAVVRSGLLLKLLTYEPTGAIIAAPTTSLPEDIGGVRNWDYRFTWMRDSALILYALMTIGYWEEAADFFGFLETVHKGHPDTPPQIMYTIEGKTDLPEHELAHLEGYRGSRPVRIGNGAAQQHQLDIFGEILAAASLYYRGAQQQRPISAGTWQLLCGFVNQAAERWQEPGHGIWEVRGQTEMFLYSRLMCWVALDRGIRLAEAYNLDAPLDKWRAVRAQVRDAILSKGVDPERQVFTQAFGSQALDAATLMIPQTGFLPASDPRVEHTVAAVRTELTENGLVYRYRNSDSLPGGEGTFTLCTFWLVSALALAGKVGDAQDLFERTAAYANDLGLMSEEINPTTGAMLGNFPQGFTHLALIQAAVSLAKITHHGAENEPETEGERAQRATSAAANRPTFHSTSL